MNYTKENTKKKIKNINDKNINDDDDDLLRFLRGGIGAKCCSNSIVAIASVEPMQNTVTS